MPSQDAAGPTSELEALRAENALLTRQLEAARRPVVIATDNGRLEAMLPAGPGAPATARAALTRWLTGQVPGEVLDNARLLASELVTNRLGQVDRPMDASLRVAAQLRHGALRVDVRDPESLGEPAARALDRPSSNGFEFDLVKLLATRWGVDHTSGTHLWFEMDTVGRTG
jgi:hypothetical protein